LDNLQFKHFYKNKSVEDIEQKATLK